MKWARTTRVTGIAVCSALLVGCDRKPAAATTELLTDVTVQAGIDFIHDKHDTGDFRFPEINGAGVGVIDYDNDGWFDLYFVQSAKLPGVEGGRLASDQLYRNRGDGTFENVTRRAGINVTGFGMGVVCGDVDNDGHTDIYVFNTGPDVLLHNNGDGTFTDTTKKAGLGDYRWGDGAAFFDYDADGWLDLFVCNYVAWTPENEKQCWLRDTSHRDYCGPLSYKPEPDALYRNNGDGTFTDVSAITGIGKATGSGMGVGVADFNGDGLQDVYVGNDARPNRLWIQQPDHTFADQADIMLCDRNEDGREQSSMGITIEDFDLDGTFDLLLGHFREDPNTIYLNRGMVFKDDSRSTGLHSSTLRFTTFGISVLDLRNDGTMHCFFGNGNAHKPAKVILDPDNPYGERDLLMEWSFEKQHFTDITDTGGSVFETALCTRGTAIIDYDNDGDMDLVVCSNNGPARLLRNNAPANSHWLMVRAIGPDRKRDAYGAVVEVEVNGKPPRRRPVYTAYSYCSSCDPRIHFGLGRAAQAKRITVHWLDGRKDTWHDVSANQVFVARYGTGTRKP